MSVDIERIKKYTDSIEKSIIINSYLILAIFLIFFSLFYMFYADINRLWEQFYYKFQYKKEQLYRYMVGSAY